LSLVCASVLGETGEGIYFLYTCWNGTQACLAYDRFAVVVAYVLAGPVFLINWLAIGVADRPHPFAGVWPVGGYWWIAWLVLWAYYYLILALLVALFRRFRTWIRVRSTPLSFK